MDAMSEEDEEPKTGTARLVEVEVSPMSGDTLEDLSVPDTCLISELKLLLEKREGIPHQQLQLLLAGVFQNLEDQQTVKDCDVSGGRLQLILVRNASFWPSKTFNGSKEGYIFTCRDQGVGYYIDSYEDWMGRGASDPWDGLWESGDGTTIVIQRGTIFWGLVGDSRVSLIVEKAENEFTLQYQHGSKSFRATLAGPDDLRFDEEVRGMGRSIPEKWMRETKYLVLAAGGAVALAGVIALTSQGAQTAKPSPKANGQAGSLDSKDSAWTCCLRTARTRAVMLSTSA
eukprot:s1102_g6.t1